MTLLSDEILQKVEVLAIEDQQKVLSFVEFLLTKKREAMTTSLKTSHQSFLMLLRI